MSTARRPGKPPSPQSTNWPLLAELLPAEEGFLRVGGENADQSAEYHRGKRLAEAVLDAMTPNSTSHSPDLDTSRAATQFTEWLRARYVGRSRPDGIDEAVEELANSWHISRWRRWR